MPITPKKKKKILEYYDEQVVSGSNRYVTDTSTKFNVSKGSVRNYVKQRDNPSEVDVKETDTDSNKPDITYSEIAQSRKDMDEAFNKKHYGMIDSPTFEGLLRSYEEEYPLAEEEIKQLFKLCVEEHQRRVKTGVIHENREALYNGETVNSIVSNLRKPLTKRDQIKEKEDALVLKKFEAIEAELESDIKEEEVAQARLDDIKTNTNKDSYEDICLRNKIEKRKDFNDIKRIIDNPYTDKKIKIELIKDFEEKWAERAEIEKNALIDTVPVEKLIEIYQEENGGGHS